MVVRVAQQAQRSGAARVVVATDDVTIADTVEQYGIEAVMTSPDHPSGTDRLAEACSSLNVSDNTIVVNVQGDEPLIDPDLVGAVAKLLGDRTEVEVATAAHPIDSASTLFDSNAVKVVCNHRRHALYFSRAPIPWARDALAAGERVLAPSLPALRHIGLYAYRAGFLRRFPHLPRGPLERFESLEQLRVLENGYAIAVHITNTPPAPGVDTPEDLAYVQKLVEDQGSPESS